jgi:hypothetical protein
VARSVYVYGVVAAAGRDAVRVDGIEGCAVRAIADDRLAALVSDLDDDALSAAQAVRAHWRVLDAAAASTTVVPARFGTILADDAAVRDQVLAADADGLERLLAALADRVQLKVEGRYDEARLMRAIVAASPAIAALRRRIAGRSEAAGYYDRIRLGEAVAAAIDARRAADTDRARAVLAPYAEADRVEDPRTPDTAFNLSFLVARERVDAFGEGVGTLRDAFGDDVAIRYVGPLPPSSFADADLTAAGAA